MARQSKDYVRRCVSVSSGKSGETDSQRHKVGKSIWWMLLSHHAPCDLDRTWTICGVHVCVRCFAMSIAVCLVFAASCSFCIPYTRGLLSLCLLLMLPAGIDFTLEELLAAYPASNVSRFATGFLFGTGGGICLVWLFLHGKWGPILFFTGGAIVMQFVIALIFLRLGHLRQQPG